MSSEDRVEKIERQMEFIIGHQAQFASDIQQLREAQAATVDMLERLAATTTAGFEALIEHVSALADSQLRMQESLAQLAQAQARTDERLNETDERLNSLINVVERYISERRNGEP